MFDKLLDGLSIFDWITPTAAAIQDLAKGPSYTLMIPVECGLTGGEIAGALGQRGIESWGHMVVNGHFMITVRQSQLAYAEYVLERQGILGGSASAPVGHRKGKLRGRQGGQGSLWDLKIL